MMTSKTTPNRTLAPNFQIRHCISITPKPFTIVWMPRNEKKWNGTYREKKQSYVSYLHALSADASLINKDDKGMLSQYFLLKYILYEYRQMEKKGGWKSIVADPKFKSYKVGDSCAKIAQIRQRLFISNDIATNSKSAIYDKTLATGILKCNKRIGNAASTVVLPELIKDLNVPVAQRIKTFTVNIERCR
jgi:murein L,D-transpeptidase YcbB/YkuD